MASTLWCSCKPCSGFSTKQDTIKVDANLLITRCDKENTEHAQVIGEIGELDQADQQNLAQGEASMQRKRTFSANRASTATSLQKRQESSKKSKWQLFRLPTNVIARRKLLHSWQ